MQNENIIGYVKATPDNSDIVAVLVNLDPYSPQEAWFDIPTGVLGINPEQQYTAVDLLSGETHSWTGAWQHLRLDPQANPAMILHLQPWVHVDYVDLVL